MSAPKKNTPAIQEKKTQRDNSTVANIVNGPNGQKAIEAVELISVEITAVVIVAMLCGYLPKLNIGNATLAFSRG